MEGMVCLLNNLLKELCAARGLSGNEKEVAELIRGKMLPYCDEVKISPLYSVIGHKKGNGPKVMLAAHLDEIGLIVTKIEEDGSLRIGSVGGVDPRILPSMRVKVLGKKAMTGVIGAKPPHLLTEADRKKNYKRDELFVDLGLPKERVEKLVKIGDLIQLETRFVELLNNRVATKTADDRSLVCVMIEAMRRLSKLETNADIYFVATCQEEVGAYGALTSSYDIEPDFAVAMDVCHAKPPDASVRTLELGSLCSTVGPTINPFLRRKLIEIAKEENIEVQTSVSARDTSTDADEIATIRNGVPTILLEVPVKYMHTAVELLDMRLIKEGGRLLERYFMEIDDSWREEIWN